MQLSELPIGGRGVILEVSGTDAIATRLMEMGVFTGEQIEVRGAAPLGDPREYLICGYQVSLRKSEAQRVEIEPHS